MAYPKRSQQGSDGQPHVRPIATCKMSKEYPSLWSFLSDVRWEDGSEREPGTVLLCVGDGQVRLWLHDRGEGEAAWLTGDTLTEALLAAERALKAGSVAWRSTAKGPKKKA